MQTSDRGLLALIRHEGVVPGPYLDVKDVWTFGIGHTPAAGPPDPARMPRGMPIDLDAGIREAFRVFRADLARFTLSRKVEEIRRHLRRIGRETCPAAMADPFGAVSGGGTRCYLSRVASPAFGT